MIEVRGVEKTFRIPKHRVDTFKERAAHPLRRSEYRELRALRGVSFDVGRGEFFGIVGRNGSGKSTLLKVLSSIYRADAGSIRIGGRLAPFIELGVGFNPELTARENVALNGVMMGLGRRDAARRLDSVLDFADLREFVDLKLKNYSSGMNVRLAFAVMVEADADIMLVDEVLAVGDAAFAQKCMDVFEQKRDAGKTVVLVTHNMALVQSFCDRAMLLHDGNQHYTGDPEETALRYYRLNFGGSGNGAAASGAVPDVNVKLLEVWLENGAGERVDNVEQGDPIRLELLVEARHELLDPVFNFQFLNEDGVYVFRFSKRLGEGSRLRPGQRVRLSARADNPLLPGRYVVNCWVSRKRPEGDLAMHVLRLLDFLVYGTRPGPGSVSVDADVRAALEPEA
jgi:ABC-type polysaccharide/polyol phosphate transport system ATPase subunit